VIAQSSSWNSARRPHRRCHSILASRIDPISTQIKASRELHSPAAPRTGTALAAPRVTSVVGILPSLRSATWCLAFAPRIEVTPHAGNRIATEILSLVSLREGSTDSNDEVERRGASPASNEGTLSQSSTHSLAHRRRDPRSLEPIVRPC